jgi:pilus assembly protein CpaF
VFSPTNFPHGAVFSVVISEKGGAERREEFDHGELTIGRIQGNDLILPKGNVSKKHARIAFRDGRYIVTDLNSTNGTYVNRRRINQATIVRPGDRIYVGDFVLRIEGGEDVTGSMDRASAPAPRAPMGTAPEGSIPAGTIGVSPSGFPSPHPGEVTGSLQYPAVPPAPRVPARGPDSGLSPLPSSTPMAQSDRVTREDSVPSDVGAYRTAVASIVRRVEAKLGLAALEGEMAEASRQRVERALAEEIAAARNEGSVGATVAEEPLKRDTRAELLEMGPLTALLEDESVTEISVIGTQGIAVLRNGLRTNIEPPVSTAASARRILGRLCRRAGAPLHASESVVERELDAGFHLSALTGDAVGDGALLRLERPQRADASLDDLVRAGCVSRAMATFLRQCVYARANILVVGGQDSRTATVLSALCSAAPKRPVVAISEHEQLGSASSRFMHIDGARAGERVGEAIDIAARMPEARLAVERLTGATALAVLDAIAMGADGVLAALPSPTIRRGLALLPLELASDRPGTSPGTFRSWLGTAFDLYVEVATLRDGRQRVLRVAEPLAVAGDEIRTQDIFSFFVERTATGGSVEGTFQATGSQPRVVEDMIARGIPVDRTLFTRSSR